MRRLITVIVLLCATQYTFAQQVEEMDKADTSLTTASKTSRAAYVDIAYGIQYLTFRDLATSPLFYNGSPNYVALSHIDLDPKRESSFRLSYAFGNFQHNAARYNAVSTVRIFSINYVELFELGTISNPKFNVKVGGQFNSIANIRENEALGNNSDGFEVISTLFGTIKGTLDMRRKKRQRKSNLAFGLHVGLLNTAYRNGWMYTRQSPILNQDDINDGYVFRWLTGYRMNSSVAYTFWLKNGNALQLSYLWDAYTTGGNRNQFEMAAHLLQLSILFNLK